MVDLKLSLKLIAKSLCQLFANFATSWGSSGGQVVSVLALYSDDPSSNPAEACCLAVNYNFEKNENKEKEAGVDPLKNK